MTELELVLYPDPVLRKRAAPLAAVDEQVAERVAAMFELMYAERGVGLAAPQVGWSTRLFVVNPTGEPDPGEERVYINPEIVEAEGSIRDEEGCLSIPGVRGKVERSERIVVRAQDLQGNRFQEDSSDLLARVIQHELDHLDGILFISRLRPTEKLLVKKALAKLEKEYKESRRG